MNLRLLPSTLIALLPLAAAAAPSQTPAVLVDCARPVLPTQRAVAEMAGIANLGQAYALRTRLMLDVQRACKSGAGQVRLVRDTRSVSGQPAIAVAAVQP